MRIICLILFLAILSGYSTKTQLENLNGVKCKKCLCYELKCTRLDDPDEGCENKFRNSCDNSEDITEADFCNIQCDCCLENKCFVWNDYSCLMFRSYEFSNIIYFILLTVNAFFLIR